MAARHLFHYRIVVLCLKPLNLGKADKGENMDPSQELLRAIHLLNENIEKLNELLDKRKRKPAERRNFVKPTLPEIRQYIEEVGAGVNPATFYNFYESKGWKVGKTGMRCWKAAIRTWNQKGKENGIMS